MKYPGMEKLAFALVVASRKLRPYFQTHAIIVITDQPIKKSMSRLDVAHMVQWAIELSQLDIKYKPRTTIKAQAMIDFIAEFTLPKLDLKLEYKIAYADGSSVKGLGGAGVVIISLEKDILKYEVQLQFPATKNQVEYEAVLTSLRIAKALGAKNLKLKTDSKLVVGQTTNEYEAKEKRMQKYLRLTQ
ncbi:uncharacterized protein LOC142606259 [Castanea sativa]|uniref:uncharacterized protein LOC142606259 n=1 Tax=Castanea sativa TaxID=21020 RepID=UPI003F650706